MQLPPGQQLAAAAKWPLVGEKRPRDSGEPWTVTVSGLVNGPRTFSLEELRTLPQIKCSVDIHCVTRWSKPGLSFGGVLLAEVVALTRPHAAARYVSFTAQSERNHSTSLVLDEALELGTLLALECDDRPLGSEHGGPVRVVVPKRYFYKSLKWLHGIEFLSHDRLGYWEAVAGYHNHADPWREERYMAPGMIQQQATAVLATRDWSNRDLRSIDASGRQLGGLVAHRALLRDANFRNCDLREACFREANLSNAHFERADLRGASFAAADCEGADFTGADLREVDLRCASLFGASFCAESTTANAGHSCAIIDGTTRIDSSAIEQLTPTQQEFVQKAMAR